MSRLRGPWLSFRVLVQLFFIFGVFSAATLGQGVARPSIGDDAQRRHPASSTALPVLSSHQKSGMRRCRGDSSWQCWYFIGTPYGCQLAVPRVLALPLVANLRDAS